MADITTIIGEGAFDGTVRNQINANFTALNSGSSGSILHQATKVFTNAQLIALATTGIEVIPSPGANKVLISALYTGGSNSGVVYMHWVADYGNASGRTFQFYLGSPNNVFAYQGFGDFFVWGAADPILVFGPQEDISPDVIPSINSVSDFANKGLSVKVAGGSGNFTGGDAGNTMTMVVPYLVLNTLTGLFE